ncbi:MAG: TniQ family protein [Anaerolineae bacterium]|nr:TniQ family protein [Anaerolineae bacterium]
MIVGFYSPQSQHSLRIKSRQQGAILVEEGRSDTNVDWVSYDVWDDSVPTLPARASLYDLQPMGVGTALVEGLHSYLMRLAQAHGTPLATLIRFLVQPQSKKLAPLQSALNSTVHRMKQAPHSDRVSGTGIWAARMLMVLDQQMTPSNLHQLTLIDWQPVLSASQLCHQSTVWCPACFRQWVDHHQPLYLPLLWSLRDVVMCPQHTIPLQRECPSCNARQSSSKISPQIGICMYCHASLAMPESPSPMRPVRKKLDMVKVADVDSWELWCARAIQELVLKTQLLPCRPHPDAWIRSIKHCLSVSGCTIRQLAGEIDVNPRLINGWLRSVSRPTMTHVLRISYCFGLPIHRLLDGSASQIRSLLSARSLPRFALTTRIRTDQSWQQLQQRLDEYVADEWCMLSLNQISIRLGRSLAFLAHHFPVHYLTLIQRRRNRQATSSSSHKRFAPAS